MALFLRICSANAVMDDLFVMVINDVTGDLHFLVKCVMQYENYDRITENR